MDFPESSIGTTQRLILWKARSALHHKNLVHSMALITMSGYPSSGKSRRALQIKAHLESRIQDSSYLGPRLKVSIISDDDLSIDRRVYGGTSHIVLPCPVLATNYGVSRRPIRKACSCGFVHCYAEADGTGHNPYYGRHELYQRVPLSNVLCRTRNESTGMHSKSVSSIARNIQR